MSAQETESGHGHDGDTPHEHEHVHGGHGHQHGVNADADRRYLTTALILITGFLAIEVAAGIIAGSLALISDAGHMLTDAAAIALALVAMRLAARKAQGSFTYGLQRAEVVSAQINGLTLLLLAAYFTFEGVRRLISPVQVAGGVVIVTALVGIAVNVAAAWLLAKANRTSLNVEGAYQHILNDLYAFIGTAVSGVVVWLTGWNRADAVATLVVAALMARAGWNLVREAGRIFMEAAPHGIQPDEIGARAAALDHVVEVHDLHLWEVSSGRPALSAHILVAPDADCHAVRAAAEELVQAGHGIRHTTLQVDHVPADTAPGSAVHCGEPHGPVHRK
ncbi:cation diffusion facilitator family transporter [Streptomyces sp. NBC_00239]|uniref:cation diffusion facilitator family transporter n=1 Tax=Streptomyces sp. NBC_00239 TaxID=2903640 RepID=UPI002E2939DB|nr:cation diffusion facilitator family transporter [Streptomyces sp. NBC_00239]